MNRRLEERRAEHARYKKDVKERGKPFYPFAMFHDTVMSLLVVCLIVALAVIWKYTAEEGPTDADPAGSASSTTRRRIPGRRTSSRAPTGTSTSSSTCCGSSSGRSR